MTRHIGQLDGRGRRFGIVASRFHEPIVRSLRDGAVDCLRRHHVADDDIVEAWVPGAWELPLAVRRLARTHRLDGVVAVGAVVRGATAHFEYVAGAVAQGLATVSLELDLPVGFGVLTTDSLEQAWERAGTKAGNKGWDAALATLEMVDLLARWASAP